jgi:hypothetical protein
MNRAAEKAAPEAKALFVDSVKQMSMEDGRKILDGRENEATLYFEDKTRGKLTEIFKPIVQSSMSQVGVTRQYQALDAKVRTIPFTESLSFDLDQYVTQTEPLTASSSCSLKRNGKYAKTLQPG